jgi:hypothetical protein
VSEPEYEDAADFLNDLINRPNTKPERLLSFGILWQCYVDLSHPSFRHSCEVFIASDHFKRMCELVELEPLLVRSAMLSAKPHKSKRGRTGGRKKKPMVWTSTFNSREVSSNGNNVY